MKRCYYEILEVDCKCTADEVKKNYRKLALKLHPDKNPDNEDAKRQFIEVQEAYQVLSDPNQRTWYDNNREKILFNKEDMSKEDIQLHTFGFNIWGYFTSSCYKGFGDEAGAFYQVYREVFEIIRAEEKKAYDNDIQQTGDFRKLEGFGDSTTPIQKVLRFYEDWTAFSTYKSFVWSDEYDTKEAPNRWVRRRMEEENKKERVKEKKNYIKTIKDLVDYLKKRDPRYKQYQEQQKILEVQREQERKKALQLAKKEKEQQRIIKAQLDQQRYKEIEEYYKQQNQGRKQSEEQYQEEDHEGFYCAVCSKQFRTQNQLENHNNSKLHKQNYKALFKEVALEKDLNQEPEEEVSQTQQQKKKKSKRQKKKNKGKGGAQEAVQESEGQEQQEAEQAPKKPQPPKVEVKQQTKPQEQAPTPSGAAKQQRKKKKRKKDELVLSSEQEQTPTAPEPVKPVQVKPVSKPESDEDDEDDFVSAMMGKASKKVQVAEDSDYDQYEEVNNKKGGNSNTAPTGEKQIGKAKQKRMKKEQQQKEGLKNKCMVCGQAFTSKTKMFDHIKQTGHAAPKK